MTLRSSDLQSDSDLDSIRNSCDVLYVPELESARLWIVLINYSTFMRSAFRERPLLTRNWKIMSSMISFNLMQ